MASCSRSRHWSPIHGHRDFCVCTTWKNTEVEHNFACKCYAAPARSSILLCLPLPHCSHFTGNYRRCTPFPVYCYGFRLCLCFGCDLSVGSLVGQLEINYERVGDNFVGFALRWAALLYCQIAHTTRCISRINRTRSRCKIVSSWRILSVFIHILSFNIQIKVDTHTPPRHVISLSLSFWFTMIH